MAATLGRTQLRVGTQLPQRRSSPVLGSRSGVLLRSPVQRVSVKPNAVAGLTMPVNEMTDEQRAALAKEIGFKCVGKELPDGISLTDVVKSMPPEVFKLDHDKAWKAVLISVVSFAASLFLISITPWYLLPVSWFIAGTALTGWFVIGHECAHRSFHENDLVEDILGTLVFMPILYPFEPWRIKHNHHHAHTNKLVEDTAWHPVSEEDMAKWDETEAKFYKIFLGTPLKLWASIGHWWIWHFDLNKYTEKQKPRVLVSLAAVALAAVVGLPTIVHFVGFWGLIKYWLMPWLGYHFWMSTFTVVHHTAPHIPFKPASEWNAAKAQVSGTVHCDYPAWVDFLTHDISWHVPHHVNSKIPWYNLRAATESLRKNWGQYMTETTWNWRMMKYIIYECHVYDKEKNYKPFDFKQEEPMFAFQRKVFPNIM